MNPSKQRQRTQRIAGSIVKAFSKELGYFRIGHILSKFVVYLENIDLLIVKKKILFFGFFNRDIEISLKFQLIICKNR